MVGTNTRAILTTSVACAAVNAGIRFAIRTLENANDETNDDLNEKITLALSVPVVVGSSLALLTNDNRFNAISIAPVVVMGIGAVGLVALYWLAATVNAGDMNRSS